MQSQLSEAADYERQAMDSRYDAQAPESLSLPARWDDGNRMQAEAQTSRPWWEVSLDKCLAVIIVAPQSSLYAQFMLQQSTMSSIANVGSLASGQVHAQFEVTIESALQQF